MDTALAGRFSLHPAQFRGLLLLVRIPRDGDQRSELMSITIPK